jgi:hypothetical protein
LNLAGKIDVGLNGIRTLKAKQLEELVEALEGCAED